MNGMFAERKVLVTGSTRGVGHATARRFLDEGAYVVIHGRSGRAVKEICKAFAIRHGNRVSGHAADLSNRAETVGLSEFADDLDVVVNCAGIFEDVRMVDADEACWDRIIETNLTAPWRLTRGLVGGLARNRGVIVNVSSDSGLLGYAGSVIYCASKGALIGLTRALAVELSPAVRALCVCPGPIDTDMMRDSVEAMADPATAREQWQSNTMLNRIASADEIAEAILFAASPVCRYQTGSLIVVDGGTTAGRRVS